MQGRKPKSDGTTRIHDSRGRKEVMIKIDGKWKQMHRHVMEIHLGRALKRDEHVHHKDENPLNNELSNLEIVTPGKHKQIHRPELKPYRPKLECKWCGAYYANSSGKNYCSAKCRFYATHVTRTCIWCNKKFVVYRSNPQVLCSRQCAGKHVRARTLARIDPSD